MKVLSVIGTRPEAIKMGPLVHALSASETIKSYVCSTGQHQSLLTEALDDFAIRPNFHLKIMSTGQSPNDIVAKVIAKLDPILHRIRPDLVLVHGDTSSALAAAIASFNNKIPIGHVEAGLRTHDSSNPWPEELNRTVIDQMANWLFVPTQSAKQNLLREGFSYKKIVVTGNTCVDALLAMNEWIDNSPTFCAEVDRKFPFLHDRSLKTIVVTCHRHETFGERLLRICDSVADLARRSDVRILWPVHPNPNVDQPVRARLGNVENIVLADPFNYKTFIYVLRSSDLVLTDSGGIQEEAPSFGIPVLVSRDKTERHEAIQSGSAELVNCSDIIRRAAELLNSRSHQSESRLHQNPFGDGRAAGRICSALSNQPFCEFYG